MAARSDLLRRDAPSGGKRAFAKAADFFASLAGRMARPELSFLWVVGAGVALVMTVSGAFRTGELPLGTRAAFWLLLMGWNTLKWQGWFALLVRDAADWWPVAGWGALALNLPLPLEVALVFRLLDVPARLEPLDIWVDALAISAGVVVGLLLLARRIRRAAAAPAGPVATGLMARLRFDPASLVAISAEDHYCRLRFVDGSSRLVHYRFGDAVADMAGVEGAQVHRGSWVAAAAVTGASRDGRRWRLMLSDGSRVPVSERHVAAVRGRGWLAPPAAPLSRGNSPLPASPSDSPSSPPAI